MTRHERHDIRGDPDHFVSEVERSTRTVVDFEPAPYTIHESTPCSRNNCDASRDAIYVYSMDQVHAEVGSDVDAEDIQDLQIVEYLDEPIVQVAVQGTTITLDPDDEIVEDPLDACHGEDPFEQEPDAFEDDPYADEPYMQPQM